MDTSTKAKQILKLIREGENLFLPNVSVDSVIFGYENGELQVLLLQATEDGWMLPGGYVYKTESLNAAAERNVFERIGLENTFLKQFFVFGGEERSFENGIKDLFDQVGLQNAESLWIFNRFISVGYYALVDKAQTNPTPNLFAKSCRWFNVYQLPKLLLDHEAIIMKGLVSFRNDLSANPIAYHLLPRQFTMPELHKVFQTVHHKTMDRSRFQKKMLESNVFERIGAKKGFAHRSPFLYQGRE